MGKESSLLYRNSAPSIWHFKIRPTLVDYLHELVNIAQVEVLQRYINVWISFCSVSINGNPPRLVDSFLQRSSH